MKKFVVLLTLLLCCASAWGQKTKFEEAKDKTGVLYDETKVGICSIGVLCNAGTSPTDFDFNLITLTNISTSAKTTALEITITSLITKRKFYIDKDEFNNIISSLKYLKSKTETTASIMARNKAIKFAKGGDEETIDLIVKEVDFFHFNATDLIGIFSSANSGKAYKR